ncbi:MAG: hypothetical protein CM15mP107_3820 [Bacteroidota bacterium]|nr:MAG: hypothetical protein CM15mP107_3820 [Bacteroidota bacterium]
MTLFPNCTDYPTEVLIVLDSLLVALENEVDNEGNEEVDLLFLIIYLTIILIWWLMVLLIMKKHH